MIERSTIGGTCVNVGCVPSKTLLAGAEAYHTAAARPFAGLPTSTDPVDLAAVIAQKDELVAGMRQHRYVDLAEAYGFDIVAGEARFRDPETLTVNGGSCLADAYLLATGAEPTIPALPGLREAGYLTSTTAMQQTVVPERLVVIGGGFVGLELSQLFARLGAEVVIIGRPAPRAEPELASRLRHVLTDAGVEVIEARATAVDHQGDVRVVQTDRGRSVTGTAILVATGRHARVDGLDLPAAGVAVNERGFIAVDDSLRTTNPRVFAGGDVTGGPQFVYVAAAEGHLAAVDASDGAHSAVDYTGRGGIKLVADGPTGRVLGVHALAAGAGDLILAGVYAIKFGLTVDDLASTWAPYLTMSEALRLVAQSFTQDVQQLSCCAA